MISRSALASSRAALVVTFFVAGVFASASSIEACGGLAQDDLFATSSDDGGAATDSGTKVPADSGSSGKQQDSGAVDSGATFDSGPTSTVACGTGSCVVPTQVCCRTPSGTVGTFVDQCKAPSQCTGNGVVPVACDDPTDCAALGFPGGDCCASGVIDNTSLRATSVTCTTSGMCTGDTQVVVCDVNGPVTQCPLTSLGCEVSKTTLPGYGICF